MCAPAAANPPKPWSSGAKPTDPPPCAGGRFPPFLERKGAKELSLIPKAPCHTAGGLWDNWSFFGSFFAADYHSKCNTKKIKRQLIRESCKMVSEQNKPKEQEKSYELLPSSYHRRKRKAILV